MSFGSKTSGFYSFDDAAKQASSAGKWRDSVFKLSGTANNWDDLWDAAGEKSLIELLLCGVNNGKMSRVLTVGKDRNVDFPYVSSALLEIATWTGADTPSATNPVAIFVKPGEYEDYFTIGDIPYVHIFGLGNQAESVIIQNNAHHVITVDHPTSGMGYNILKGLAVRQYGADSLSNVLFNTTAYTSLTALMCRECYFKRDVDGATTVNSDAMFKVQHGIFFGEDVRVEMVIGTDGGEATTYNPHMFYAGNGDLVGILLRNAKIDYTTHDISDENSIILTHDDFTGSVEISGSEFNISNEADTGDASAVFNFVKSAAGVLFHLDHSILEMSDNGGKKSDFVGFKLTNAGAAVFTGHNFYQCNMARGGTAKILDGNGSGTFQFDYLFGCDPGSLDAVGGVYYRDGYGLCHALQNGGPDGTAPNDGWQYWFEQGRFGVRGQVTLSGDGLTYDRNMTYEDWAHNPQEVPLDATYPTYRLLIPTSIYYNEQYYFVPGRPVYNDAGGYRCHGIVTAASLVGSDWQVDIAGHIPQVAEGYSATSWYAADFHRVVVESFTIPGLFAYQADTALLQNYLGQFFSWRRGQARIVQISHRVVTKDSGANQPRVNVSVDGNKVGTSNSGNGREVNTSWVHTVDDIDGPVKTGYNNNYNKLVFGSAIEITVDANGSNKDAADLTVIITAVLE
jgi:hypothetical protein